MTLDKEILPDIQELTYSKADYAALQWIVVGIIAVAKSAQKERKELAESTTKLRSAVGLKEDQNRRVAAKSVLKVATTLSVATVQSQFDHRSRTTLCIMCCMPIFWYFCHHM